MTGFGPLGLEFFAAFVTFFSVPAARGVARATGFMANPRADRIHRVPTPLLGGPACLIGIAIALALGSLFPGSIRIGSIGGSASPDVATNGIATAAAHPFPTLAVAVGIVAFFLLGLWDDRRPLRAVVKGTLQGAVFLTVLLLWRPQGLLSGPVSLALLWLVGMVLLNAWNYIDHADGLFALAAFAAAVVLAISCGRIDPVGGPALLLWLLAGACVGFFLWNRPPARIFLGDAGSLALGFILVISAAWSIDRGGPAALPASVGAHGVVLADLMLVTGVRLSRRKNIFVGGCEHSGHRMAAWVGGGVALVFFAIVNALFVFVALRFAPGRPIAATAVLLLLTIGLSLFLTRLAPPRSHA